MQGSLSRLEKRQHAPLLVQRCIEQADATLCHERATASNVELWKLTSCPAIELDDAELVLKTIRVKFQSCGGLTLHAAVEQDDVVGAAIEFECHRITLASVESGVAFPWLAAVSAIRPVHVVVDVRTFVTMHQCNDMSFEQTPGPFVNSDPWGIGE